MILILRSDIQDTRMLEVLQWNHEIRLADLLTVATLLLSTVALLFTAYQIRKGRVASRQQFLFTTFDRYFRDSGVRDFYYRVDYTEQPFSWKFDPDTFPGSAEEPFLDYLLHTYSLIEQMIVARVLDPRDIKLLGFEALRVIENPEVVRYLAWLDKDYDEILGSNIGSYSDARALGKRFRELRDSSGRSILG